MNTATVMMMMIKKEKCDYFREACDVRVCVCVFVCEELQVSFHYLQNINKACLLCLTTSQENLPLPPV